MPFYNQLGSIPRKRHTAHFDDDGHRFNEELVGQEGFSSRSSLLYHRHNPSAITNIAPVAMFADKGTPDHPMMPRHVRTGELDAVADVVTERRPLLANNDLTVSWARTDGGASSLYRNARGDELVYVQSGTATLQSVFGPLDVGPGDYVVVPMSTTHRWVTDGPLELLIVEARGHISPPKRYLTSGGQFMEHSPYCERDIRTPTELLNIEETDVDVLIKTHAGMTCHTHAHHPFDVVGWDGYLFPWAFNIADFEPIVGRIHQPPPVHQTFEGPGFVICSFVPRLYDFHPDAVKVPYHHANVDSDEVLFYSDGNFMSREGSGIGVGSMSFHPAGFTHGPQPGSYEKSVDQTETRETAVMIDTFAPLNVTDAARETSAPHYPQSWL